jgi:hypothetical protein
VEEGVKLQIKQRGVVGEVWTRALGCATAPARKQHCVVRGTLLCFGRLVFAIAEQTRRGAVKTTNTKTQTEREQRSRRPTHMTAMFLEASGTQSRLVIPIECALLAHIPLL